MKKPKHSPQAANGPGSVTVHGRPGHLIRRAHQIVVSIFMEELQRAGITPVQYAVLQTLVEYPGTDQVTLAGLVALDAANLGSVVSRLAKRGLLSRRSGRQDRRAKQLFAAPAGRELLHTFRANFNRVDARILAPLNRKERAIFMRLLEKLVWENNRNSRAPFSSRRPVAAAIPQKGSASRKRLGS